MMELAEADGSERDVDELDRKLLQGVEEQRSWMHDLLLRLMSLPSTTDHEVPAQEVVKDIVDDLGLESVRVPLDVESLRTHSLASPVREGSAHRYNVVGQWHIKNPTGKSLALSGHVDVLDPPALSLWPSPPFPARSEDGSVTGWGGLKGGLVAMLGTLKALRDMRLEPSANLRLQSVVEEELGGNGALAANVALKPTDAALVAGCAGDTVSVAQTGVVWLAITVEVPPAHASTSESSGSAITKALQLSTDLTEYTHQLAADPPDVFRDVTNPLAFNLGSIHGGTTPSLTPDRCTIRCRIGMFPGETPHTMRQRIERRVATFAAQDDLLRQHAPTVILDGFAAHGYELDPNLPFVQHWLESIRRTGVEPRMAVSTTATDTRAFVGTGTPAICAGPPVQNLHGVLERVVDADLVAAAQRMVLFVARWCGVRPDRNQ